MRDEIIKGLKKQGGQSVLKNFELIAHQLRVEPNILLKYLRKMLAMNIQISEGKAYIVGGIVTVSDVEPIIKMFINKYVLC